MVGWRAEEVTEPAIAVRSAMAVDAEPVELIERADQLETERSEHAPQHLGHRDEPVLPDRDVVHVAVDDDVAAADHLGHHLAYPWRGARDAHRATLRSNGGPPPPPTPGAPPPHHPPS